LYLYLTRMKFKAHGSGSRASPDKQKHMRVYGDWPGVVNIAGLGFLKGLGTWDPMDWLRGV